MKTFTEFITEAKAVTATIGDFYEWRFKHQTHDGILKPTDVSPKDFRMGIAHVTDVDYLYFDNFGKYIADANELADFYKKNFYTTVEFKSAKNWHGGYNVKFELENKKYIVLCEEPFIGVN